LTQLKVINFEPALLDTATEKAAMLGSLYAKAFIERGSKEAKVMRDRAFTYMRIVMSEILTAAEYAFRKDRSRLDYYYSSYRSRRNSAASSQEQPVEAVAA
jgi:hypothetical protein